MIPSPDYFEPTGDTLTDTGLKLNLLSRDQTITWTYHEEDPRDSHDRYAQRESGGDGQWFTYQPDDAEWTFLVYELNQPAGPTVISHLEDRVRYPHLQVLDSQKRVAVDFPHRGVIRDLFDTVYRSYQANNEALQFISAFAEGNEES